MNSKKVLEREDKTLLSLYFSKKLVNGATSIAKKIPNVRGIKKELR